MASYYFLLSSLPMLRADGGMPFSYSEFLQKCRPCVSDARYAILQSLTPDSDKGPLLAEWSKYYAVFKRELNSLRGRRLGRPEERSLSKDETVLKEISAALGDKNPLDAEKALLSLQFKKLDELIGTHYFDDRALTGYALKLKLLERKSCFDQKKGKAELDRILDGLQKQILLEEQG